MMRRIASVLMAPALAGTMAAGCVSGQDARNGALRFLHAVPDAPRMSLSVNGVVRAAGFDFTNGSAYVVELAGTYPVKIDELLPDGIDEGSEADLKNIFDELASLAVNDEVTLVVVGQFGSEETVQIRTQTRGVPTGRTRVQFVHAAVGGQTLDAYVTAPDAVIAVSTPFESGLAYKAFTPQQEISGGSVKVVLTAAGDPNIVVFDSGTVFFGLESTLLIAVVPNVGLDAATRPFSLVFMTGTGAAAVIDKDTQANVRFVNVSPGSYALDAFINKVPVDDTARQTCDPVTEEADTPIEVCAMPYESVGPFSAIDPAVYDIKVQKTGDAAVLATTFAGALAAGSQSTLVFSGLIADTATATEVGLQTLFGTRRVETVGQLRLVDLSLAADEAVAGDPTTDRIEIYITEPGAALAGEDPDFANLRFGSNTGYFSQVPGDYQLTVAKSDTATPEVAPEVLLTQVVSLDASGIYTLVIGDSVGGVAPIRFLSLDDDPAPAP